MSITQKIIARLNSDDAVLNGLSNRDAKPGAVLRRARCKPVATITFSFPAPVVSGACSGRISIRTNGSIFDDTSQTRFANYDAWLADLESMMEA